MMCLTIEIGHKDTSDPGTWLTMTKSTMKRVDKLFVKINYQQTDSMLHNVDREIDKNGTTC